MAIRVPFYNLEWSGMRLKCIKNPFDITTAVIILSRHYAYHGEKDAKHFPVKHTVPFLQWKIISTHTRINGAGPSSRSDWRNLFSAETIQRSFRVWSNGKSVFVTHRRCNISCHTLIWGAWHTLLTVDCTCTRMSVKYCITDIIYMGSLFGHEPSFWICDNYVDAFHLQNLQ